MGLAEVEAALPMFLLIDLQVNCVFLCAASRVQAARARRRRFVRLARAHALLWRRGPRFAWLKCKVSEATRLKKRCLNFATQTMPHVYLLL